MKIKIFGYSFYGVSALGVMVAVVSLVGCAREGVDKKSPEFFTSGSPDADQRAEQRMAKSEQLKETKGVFAKKEDNHSLYDRLGGDKAMHAIVDDFIPRALADPRINWERKDVKQGGISIHRGKSVTWSASPQNIEMLKKHMVQFLALSTGGPAEYSGKKIKEAHGGLHITNAEFDASIGDLKATLDKMQIPVKEQKELLAIVESTRTEIAEER